MLKNYAGVTAFDKREKNILKGDDTLPFLALRDLRLHYPLLFLSEKLYQ